MSLLEREVLRPSDFDLLNQAVARFNDRRDGLVVPDASEELVSKRPESFFSEKFKEKIGLKYLESRDEKLNIPQEHDFLTIFNADISPRTRCLVHYGDDEDISFAVKFLTTREKYFVSEELTKLPNTAFYTQRRERIRKILLRVRSPLLAAAIEKHKALEAAKL